MSESCMQDREGRIVEPGNFVELINTEGGLLKGPLKYEGFQHGTHIWSVGGGQFTHSKIGGENISLLPWRRWRKPLERAKEFWGYIDSN